MRNRVDRFISFASLILILILVVSCASYGQKSEIRISAFSEWDIHSAVQVEYLSSENWKEIKASGSSESSKPVSPSFRWKYSRTIEDKVISAELHLSEYAGFSDERLFCVPGNGTCFNVDDGSLNLKVNTTYFWYVSAVLNDGNTIDSEVGSFTTGGGIRNISIDGVTNCRDMGGYSVSGGGTIRQGLLYRTGRFNVKYSTEKLITEKGLSQIRELGIATDIDLRGDKSNLDENGNRYYANGYMCGSDQTMISPLGEDVIYVFAPAVWNTSLLMDTEGEEMVRTVFDVLSDTDSYPVVFHCSIGTDRTGVIAFLIGCSLGMSDLDLHRDYMFSNFGNIGSAREAYDFNASTRGAARYPGNTLAEKGVAYLLSIGVTQEQIDRIRGILIEN